MKNILFLCLLIFTGFGNMNLLLAQWVRINGLDNLVINCVAVAPAGSIFAGTDIGIFKYNGTNWVPADSGMPSPPSDISILVFSNDYSTVFAASDTKSGLYRSTDNGVTWAQPDSNLLKITAMVAAHDGSMIVNASANYSGRIINGIFHSTDNGIQWVLVDSSIDAYFFNVTSDGKIFAATDSGVYRSTDNGQNWVQNGLYNYVIASAFAASPNGSTLIASCAGYVPGKNDTTAVFVSTDEGKSWRQINNGTTNLTSTAVWGLAISPVNSLIFAGTFGNGIFLSKDNGQNWISINDSLPTYDYTSTFAFSPDGSLIYAGTYSDGIWKRPLSDLTSVVYSHTSVPNGFSLSQNYPNPFNPSTVINYALPKSSNVKIEIFNVLGEKVATLENKYEEAGNHKVQWNAGKYASGVYLYRLKAGSFEKTKKMILIK